MATEFDATGAAVGDRNNGSSAAADRASSDSGEHCRSVAAFAGQSAARWAKVYKRNRRA